MRRGMLIVAVVLAAGFGAPEPAAADVTEAERIVFGRSCDSGPEHPLSFIAADGSGRITRPELGDFIGVRVSPSEYSTSMAGELLTSQTPTASRASVNLQNGTVTVYDDDPPPVPYSSNSIVAWGGGEFDLRIAWAGRTGSGNPAITVVSEKGFTTLVEYQPDGFAGFSGLDWYRPADNEGLIWSVDDPRQPGDNAETYRWGISGPYKLGAGGSPRWSHDGSLIAFVLDGELALMDGNGGNIQLLGLKGWSPVWSPDSTEIAFISQPSSIGTQYIGIYDVATGTARELVVGTEECDDVFALWDWATTVVPKQTFVDVPQGRLFFADIEWLADQGITKGCNPPTNDLFCPDSTVTRGEMAAFLVRALNLKDRLDDPFTDDDGSIFQADIERLAAAGITKGCNPPTNDLFCPLGRVTRGQMAAFLVRALGYTDNGGGDLFVDDDQSIFENDIDRLGTAGVTRGCNPPINDRFCPAGFVSRDQMAAFLHRALG